MTSIKPCTCVHKAQDKMYGKAAERFYRRGECFGVFQIGGGHSGAMAREVRGSSDASAVDSKPHHRHAEVAQVHLRKNVTSRARLSATRALFWRR